MTTQPKFDMTKVQTMTRGSWTVHFITMLAESSGTTTVFASWSLRFFCKTVYIRHSFHVTYVQSYYGGKKSYNHYVCILNFVLFHNKISMLRTTLYCFSFLKLIGAMEHTVSKEYPVSTCCKHIQCSFNFFFFITRSDVLPESSSTTWKSVLEIVLE